MAKFHNRVGEVITATNGLTATIIAYRSSVDLDVQFSDGVIKTHITYGQFAKGQIKHPDITCNNRVVSRIGETNIATNGMQIRIIKYRNSDDVDIEFEDGVVVTHRAYRSFKTGKLAHPTKSRADYIQESRIGQENTNYLGQHFKIIAYRDSCDLDVQFDNGAIIRHRKYFEFKTGKIRYRPSAEEHIGETYYDIRGIKLTVVAYRNVDDVDVEFETGVVAQHKQYHQLHRHSIGHPLPYQLGNITMENVAYVFGGIGNFYCRCNKCGIQDIMTIDEMKSHICNI